MAHSAERQADINSHHALCPLRSAHCFFVAMDIRNKKLTIVKQIFANYRRRLKIATVAI
jgi:hypothetical protein